METTNIIEYETFRCNEDFVYWQEEHRCDEGVKLTIFNIIPILISANEETYNEYGIMVTYSLVRS